MNPRKIDVTLKVSITSDQEGPIDHLNDDDLLMIAETMNDWTSDELVDAVLTIEDKGELE